MFAVKSATQVEETMNSKSYWIVDEVISTNTTLLYGESEAGKSFLVSALIASLTSNTPFLGREVPDERFNVLVAYTDDDGDREYLERIKTAKEFETSRVNFVNLPVMRTPEMWQELLSVVQDAGINFLIIDNMTQAIDGEMNKDKPVRDFFEGVRLFVKAGIPVVVVGHSSEKTGMNGGKSDRPMGSSTIVQSVRWRVFVKRNGDTVTLKFAGNHAKPHEIKVRHGEGANFEELGSVSATDIAEKKQKRDNSKLDALIEKADWVVANCQGLSYRAAGDKLAEKFGGSGRSLGEALRSRDLSGLVSKSGDNVWTRVTQ